MILIKSKKGKIFVHTSLLGLFLFILLTFLQIPGKAEDNFRLYQKKSPSQNKRQRLGYMIIEPMDKSLNRRDKRIKASSRYNKYRDIILEFAQKYNMDPALIHSIISVESDYNPFAVSPKGAVGLMQLMPETARDYGVKNVYDPGENIEGGIKFLKDLNKAYKGREDLILAAYNAGPETIKRYNGVPPYPETINFIRKVKNVYNRRGRITSTKIYKFYDSSGRLVLTNNPRLKVKNGKEKRK